MPVWGSGSVVVLAGAGLVLCRSRIRPFSTLQELGQGTGRGHPLELSSGVVGRSLVSAPLAACGAVLQAPGAGGCWHRRGRVASRRDQ